MRILLLTATVIALSTTAAMQAAEPSRSKDQQICTSVARTGSRFPQRICRTRTQDDAVREQNQKDASDMINRPVVCTGKEGC